MNVFRPTLALARAALLGALAVSLPACHSDNNKTPPLTGAFRVVNGVTDSGPNGMGAQLGDVFQFSSILFGDGSGINNPPIGSYQADLDVNNVTFTVDHVDIGHNALATVFTYGTTGGGTRNGFVAKQSLDSPGGNQFAVQVVHSAYQESLTAPTLSYYFLPAGPGAIGAAPAHDAPFATGTTTFNLPAGSYRIVVTNGALVVYDSGTSATGITLPPTGSDVLQIGALDAPGAPDGSAISLLLLDNDGGSTTLLNGAH